MLEINRIYNMDCLDGLKLLDENSVDCIITDSPYLINYRTSYRLNKQHRFCNSIANDDNPQLIIDLIPLLHKVMKDNTALYMFCNCNKIDFFKREIERYFVVKNLIVWDKGNHTAGDLYAQYGKRYEFIIYANKGRAKFVDGAKRYCDIWNFPRVVGKQQLHQNQKPIDLISRMIAQHTKEGDLILDPFIGSGTTAIASSKMKRNYIGFEVDSEYFKIAERRIAENQIIYQ